jgi:hypothetical protein
MFAKWKSQATVRVRPIRPKSKLMQANREAFNSKYMLAFKSIAIASACLVGCGDFHSSRPSLKNDFSGSLALALTNYFSWPGSGMPPVELRNSMLKYYSAISKGDGLEASNHLYTLDGKTDHLGQLGNWLTNTAVYQLNRSGFYDIVVAKCSLITGSDGLSAELELHCFVPGRFSEGFPPVQVRVVADYWFHTPEGWKVTDWGDWMPKPNRPYQPRL